MKIRQCMWSAAIVLSMASAGYSQGFLGGAANRATGTPIFGKSPVKSPISDPFVRKPGSTYNDNTVHENRKPSQPGKPLGTVDRSPAINGPTNVKNFLSPNGTLFNPSTAKPQLFSNTFAGQTQPKLFSQTQAGQQNQPRLFSSTPAGQQSQPKLFSSTPAGQQNQPRLFGSTPAGQQNRAPTQLRLR